MHHLLRSTLLLCAILLTLNFRADAQDGAVADTFFKKHCLRCHSIGKREGEFRLDNLSRDFGELLVAQAWDEVLFRINSGEMPPEDEPQPTVDEVGAVVDWISSRITEGRAARMARRGPVAHYRLSRDEYAYTVLDFLGVHFDVNAPGAFNEDPRWHGFDRIGSQLSLSPSHVDRYFEAAEKIIAAAFPERRPNLSTGRVEANDARAQKWREANGVKEPVRMLLLPGVPVGSIHARSPGLYRIRLQVSALPSFKGRLPHLTIWDGQVKRSLFGQDVAAPEDKPTVIEIETFLPAGRMQLMNEAPGTFEALTLALTKGTPFTTTRERRFTHPSSYKLYTKDDEPIFPMLIVDWFEWEGPIVTAQDEQKRAGFYPLSEEPADLRSSLRLFIEQAWRRPPTEADIGRFLSVFHNELESGERFRSAWLATLVATMTAKDFYYNAEGTPGENRPTSNDWELASRLSYFLWNSMPDEPLFKAARNGTLSRPTVLKSQLSRMLDDPKVGRFLDSFPRQWLQLHRVGMFPPDPELYPDYDKWLEESMVLESTSYFAEVFRRNLPVREFLASNWTMLNPRLAMHYGLPRRSSPGFARVTLSDDDHRGGLLTHASVLSLTSDGTRHRPVHRGVWIWESVYGKSPPPPPPNVEPLAPTPADSPKATVRMQLQAHATHATCASCHRRIDPLGFAFDNYDAIGRWRTHEAVASGQGDNPSVDASGTFPDGRQYAGPGEFKKLLSADEEQFATALTGQLATYALRRVMTVDDVAAIRDIVTASRADSFRLKSLVENLVLSDLFEQR